ncbi:MAG: hypothetical protein FWG92_00530 [Leptospirales bacterium]|nr:hypothetical protein [Leptospirales bacterium]
MKKILITVCLVILFAAAAKDRFNVFFEPSEINVVPGETYTVKLKIEIPPNGYIYANPKGPGTGKASEITAEQHDFITAGEPVYMAGIKYTPVGEREFVYIYKDVAVIDIPLHINENASAGLAKFSFSLDLLFCDDNSCEPVKRRLTLPVQISGTAKDAPVQTVFEPHFIGASTIGGFLQAILLGFAAGVILNFMPCVLPVVSIKVMAFARRSGKRRELVKQGLFFAGGILATFIVLAALASFTGYSWGGLFQNEYFLKTMTVIVFVLALSMLGMFSINVPGFAVQPVREYSVNADAFFKGFLATLLATPCSGPLLGGTLAWAMTGSPLIIFAVFTSVGFGMAFPYILLCAFPALVSKIPKPGAWMGALELVMGFFLIFTVVYLLSVFPDSGVFPMVTFLAFIAAACCIYGRYGTRERAKKQRIFSLLLACLILAAGYFISFGFDEKAVEISAKQNSFSMAKLDLNRQRGVISVVAFTADWCPNCKFVESFALGSQKVKEALKQSGAELIIADITKPFPEAENLLQSLGSRSIPFLAIMPPGDDYSSPFCLRDIYSADDVVSALRAASAASGIPGF